MSLASVIVQHHAGCMKCGRMLIVIGEIDATTAAAAAAAAAAAVCVCVCVCVFKTADFHNLCVHCN
jgi:hypothetical protein